MTVLRRTRRSRRTVFANPWWSCGGTVILEEWWRSGGGVAWWTVVANPWWSCGGTVICEWANRSEPGQFWIPQTGAEGLGGSGGGGGGVMKERGGVRGRGVGEIASGYATIRLGLPDWHKSPRATGLAHLGLATVHAWEGIDEFGRGLLGLGWSRRTLGGGVGGLGHAQVELAAR
ncbi:hypothetical protein T492DRAFT_1140712 [Pavlovales sp. CCMP2436]|nr:hypothetical protein T492DRAFT_1140712 [Pavlovales sp. CCMP2436]